MESASWSDDEVKVEEPKAPEKVQLKKPKQVEKPKEEPKEGVKLKPIPVKEKPEEEKKEDFVRHEMAYGRLYRAVHLPVDVLGDEAKAELKDGVLEIFLPKVEATTPFKVKVA